MALSAYALPRALALGLLLVAACSSSQAAPLGLVSVTKPPSGGAGAPLSNDEWSSIVGWISVACWVSVGVGQQPGGRRGQATRRGTPEGKEGQGASWRQCCASGTLQEQKPVPSSSSSSSSSSSKTSDPQQPSADSQILPAHLSCLCLLHVVKR
jgi:hypothetical protein